MINDKFRNKISTKQCVKIKQHELTKKSISVSHIWSSQWPSKRSTRRRSVTVKITPSIEVVVARYKEDTSWTNNLPAKIKITIYDKSGIPNDSSIQLPNIGRESHTYLHHIITRWGSLSDMTIFSQGHPFDHCNDFLKQITGQIGNNFTGYGSILTCDNNGGPHHTGIPIILTCKQIGIKCPEIIYFYPGAQFSVSRGIIKKRPINFYQKVMSLVDKEDNPIYAYCLERLWPIIFR